MPQPSSDSVVIVTTAAKLAVLVDEAVDRAVRRAVQSVLAERERGGEWLTAREAERVYGRSRATLYRWRRDGLVASRKVAGTVYFAQPGSEVEVGEVPFTTAAKAARP